MGDKNKFLSYGAILAGISFILYMIHLYIPVIGIITIFLCPVPLVFMAIKYGYKSAILTGMVTAFLIFVSSGPLQAIFFLFSFGVTGVSIGTFLRKRYKVGFIMAATTTISLLSTLVFLIISSNIFGYPLDIVRFGSIMAKTMEQKKADLIKSFETSRLPKEEIEKNKQALEQMILYLRSLDLLFPAMLIISSFVGSTLNLVVALKILNRFKVQGLPPIPAFSRFRISWQYLWGFIFGYFLAAYRDLGITANVVGRNILFIFSIIFFVQGLAVLYFYLKKAKLNSFVKTFILVMAFIFLRSPIMFVGMFEPFFDFRKLTVTKQLKDEDKDSSEIDSQDDIKEEKKTVIQNLNDM